MKKVAGSLLPVLALSLAAGALAVPQPHDVPALTRIASRLSGLKPARKVVVRTVSPAAMRAQARRLLDRDYPPAAQAYDETVYRALGLLGPAQRLRPELLAAATGGVVALYDPATRVLSVRRGAGRRQALLHELVRALEDQRFGLRRLTRLRRSDRDAALAATAAVDGDAAFATQVLGGRALAVTPRRVAAAAAAADPLREFLRLEQQFPATVGMRLAATLHNLGGNGAVFTALKVFPTTTEQVFHIDAFLLREPALPVHLPASVEGLTLRRSDTFGELDVRALLAASDTPGLDAAASGWGGGRTGVYADAGGRTTVTLALRFDSDDDAQQWADAIGWYVRRAYAAVPDAPAGSGGVTCWSAGAEQLAFARAGSGTALAIGPDSASAAALAAAAAAAAA